MRRSIRRFVKDQNAAIAPLYAMGIGVFVVMSAVGFDYGRLMALDTELQNAADQAALAAATQLDGGDDAMTRARDAANNTFATADSAFVNETRFANDGGGRPITSLSFEFFDGYDDATDTPGDPVTLDDDGAQAKVVQVTVNARKVFYALTPLVSAFNSGDVIGKAMAQMENATCNVPPMMFCAPTNGGVVDADFPTEDDVGKALKLHFKTNGNSSGTGKNTTDTSAWAPGNFGFLDLYNISGSDRARSLGLNSQFRGCFGETIESDPGFRDPQADALNSRFDVYTGSVNKNQCNAAGDFCPAEDVRSDWVNVQTLPNVPNAQVNSRTCSSTPSNVWKRVSELPTVQDPGDILSRASSQQLPSDNCLISGSCGDNFGDGAWNGDAYMNLHHPGVSLSSVAPNGTRFEVYQWEIENKNTRLTSPKKIGYYADRKNGNTFAVDLYCSFPRPVNAAAKPASATQKDRRLLTVAAVDCTGLSGSAPVKILRWVDLFLLQTANVTSSDKNFLTEIVGPAERAGGESGFQYYSRRKAVLIR